MLHVYGRLGDIAHGFVALGLSLYQDSKVYRHADLIIFIYTLWTSIYKTIHNNNEVTHLLKHDHKFKVF